MIKVTTKIDRPINVVWDYFTETGNWNKWHGGGLKEVVPGWQKGAKLFWSLGGSSLITNIIPHKEICTSGAWMDVTYRFNKKGNTATILEIIESDPKGGAIFTDGGAAHKAQQETTIHKLKACIESETKDTKLASKTQEKNGGSFGNKSNLGFNSQVQQVNRVSVLKNTSYGVLKPSRFLGRWLSQFMTITGKQMGLQNKLTPGQMIAREAL